MLLARFRTEIYRRLGVGDLGEGESMQRHEVVALIAATLMGAQNSLVGGHVVREIADMNVQLTQAEKLLRLAEERQQGRQKVRDSMVKS